MVVVDVCSEQRDFGIFGFIFLLQSELITIDRVILVATAAVRHSRIHRRHRRQNRHRITAGVFVSRKISKDACKTIPARERVEYLDTDRRRAERNTRIALGICCFNSCHNFSPCIFIFIGNGAHPLSDETIITQNETVYH